MDPVSLGVGFVGGVIAALFLVGLARMGKDGASETEAEWNARHRAFDESEIVPALERREPRLRLVASQ